MTSVDSGVETGNDSNDSGQTESQVLFAPPSTSAIKKSKSQEAKKNPEDVKQLEPLETAEETSSRAMVCLPQSSSPFAGCHSRLFVQEGAAPLRIRQYFEDRSRMVHYNRSSGKDRLSCFSVKQLVHRPTGKEARRARINRVLESYQRPIIEKRMRIAAATNNVELLTRLLEQGVSPNNADEHGRSPLHLACSTGYTDIVKLLLDHGADPNMTDTLGNTPLHLAAVTSKTALVVLLLKAGTNIMSSDRHGYNPLQLAQTKLRMLQNHKSAEIGRIKEEVHTVVEMLLAYLEHQNDVSVEMEALSSFCSRLSLSNTPGQIQDDLKDLLANVNSLSLNSN